MVRQKNGAPHGKRRTRENVGERTLRGYRNLAKKIFIRRYMNIAA